MQNAERKRLASRQHAGGALMLAESISPAGWTSPRAEIQSLENDGIGLSPHPLITGRTLIEMGVAPGPSFQPILDAVYDAQLEGRVKDQRSALKLTKTLLKQHA